MTYHATIAPDGTISLPPQLARELGLRPGTDLAIEIEGRSLRMTPRADRPGREADEALARLRHALKGYSVDQFLAERRADWGE